MTDTASTRPVSAVSVRDLHIRYGTAKVLSGLDLEIAPSELIVLLGPSGCGKSTLLNALAGLQDVADGEIWIGGRNVTWAQPKDRGIGMVFQSYALYPRMTVEKNLTFALRVAGLPKPEISRRLAHAAQLLQLEPLLQRKPAELSGGQRQRVAIGRALVREVDVFLFDEPLSNLDARLRNELRIEIKRLHQRLGNTMIYVTHDQTEAMTLADRIAIMRGGEIQQLATPAEIYHRPANLFVAGFIGAPAMNFISGSIQQDRFVAPGLSIPLAALSLTARADEAQVTLGIRPEHLQWQSSGADAAGTPGLSGRVTLVEPMGADTVIWCESAGCSNLALRIVGDPAPATGTLLHVSFDPDRALLFAVNGERIVN